MNAESGHTALFSSTEGAVTGCTRLQEAGKPEASSDAAARGCAGVMMVEPQNGGKRRGFKKGTRSVTRPGHKDFETYKGSKRYSEKRLKKLIGRKTMRAPLFPYAGGKRRGYRKGTRSVTRPGHKDFETYKGSKRYSEKRLKKLIGRKTMRAPLFPYAGGKRGGFKKGTRSVTRPGHEDFETYKGSKMYDEKRLKKLIGRKTVRAPIFPFAGGQAQSQPLDIEEHQFASGSSVGQASSVYDQLDASASCGSQNNTKSTGLICNSANTGPQLTGGKRRGRKGRGLAVNHDKDIVGSHHGNLAYGGARRKMRGGNCQYGNDIAYGFGQSHGGIKLSASESALANPVPYTPYNHCMKQ